MSGPGGALHWLRTRAASGEASRAPAAAPTFFGRSGNNADQTRDDKGKA